MTAAAGSPRRTTPIYLVRHAKAGSRLKWTGPDHLRPLTEAGWRQAKAIAKQIGDPLTRLLSSPYIRCVQTFEPLAAARRLPIETSGALEEGAPVEGALELMRSLAAEGCPAALCTHGDVMMFCLDELVMSGLPLQGPLQFKKGSIWILDVTRREFVRGRYVPPPQMTTR